MSECLGRRRARVRASLSLCLEILTPGLLVLALSFGSLLPRLGAQTPTAVTVPTWRYDLTHSGANTHETALTPANVNANSFGKLFTLAVDGNLYAQPLYVPGLTMGDGQVHNVVYIATEHDSVYAFDADSNGGSNANPLWQVSLLSTAHGAAPGATTVSWTKTGSEDIQPEIGVTGTPVIDPATNTLFVVAATEENGEYLMRLHALNIITGAEQANSPALINATVPGTGLGSSGGKLSFSPLWQNQRAALAFYSGHVYFAFGAHGDNGPWHGWVFAYNGATLQQTAAVCLTPNGYGAGVWESGSGLPIDSGGPAGRLFLVTGNGTYTTYPPFNESSEFGESIINFDLSNGGLTPTDAFTSFNAAHLTQSDLDQGSGGILMVSDTSGPNANILVEVGKEGRILVLNRNKLGGFASGASSNTNILQDILGETKGLWSTPAYWNGNVYVWGSGDVAKMFTLNGGVLDTTPSSKGSVTSAFPGASFMISSNGSQDAIAWAIREDQYTTHGPGVLYAWDANDLSKMLYSSSTNATRDTGSKSMKFATPVVTNGKVYISCEHVVDVYGLLQEQPTAAAPTISPDGGAFSTSQTVRLATTTSSADIYFTLDGSVPSPGTQYTGPITLSTDTTINAVASAPGYIQSPVSTAAFTFTGQTPAVTFKPAGGTYTSAQSVALSDTDSNASIYFTTDGSQPSPGTGSTDLYSTAITVAASATINAIAVDPKLQNSIVSSASYVIQTGGTSINFGNGFASVAGLKLNGSTVNTDDSRLQLTNGADYQAGSVFWEQPIGIQSFTTNFSFQLSDAKADGFTFTIQNKGATALGGEGAALGYASIPKSVAIKFDLYSNAGEGTDSTGVYTNGTAPTVPAVDLTPSSIILRSGDSMVANITYDGTTLTMNLTDVVTNKSFTLTKVINIPQIVGGNTAYVGFTGSTGGLTASQKILYWTYTASASTPVTAAPSFSPSGGNYTTAQSVVLSSGTSKATIYYTTNGTTPTMNSTVYSSAIPVGTGTTKIEAFAQATGMSPSAVVSATYRVGAAVTASPTFNPPAGTYTSTQSVQLLDTNSNAVIYYTTDGSTPIVGTSKVYSAAITVAASTTINAIAEATGDSASSVATAAYTIQSTSTTPIIDFPTSFAASQLSLIDAARIASGKLQVTLAGAATTRGAAWFKTPLNISTFTTDFDFQLLNAKADGFTFTIQNDGLTAIGPAGSGLGYGASQPGSGGGIGKSVAVKFDIYNNDGEGADSTGFYTNGASPTVPATSMTSAGVILASGHVLHAHITYDGTNLTLVLSDKTTGASFAKTAAINIPTIVGSKTAYVGFTGSFGGFSMTTDILDWTLTAAGSQTVALTNEVGRPMATVSAQNMQATPVKAVQSALVNSPREGVTREPKFFPPAGEFAGDVEVTLRSDVPGGKIHYTVDGSQPLSSSPVYAGPIVVKGTALTIKAFASAPGRKDSPVITGTYHIREK